ncbi:MAG: YceI family protein [Ferruginibacter sp.]
MKHLKGIVIVAMLLSVIKSQAQEKWFTRNGKITFFSETPAENIDANNNEVFSLLDPFKNEIAFQVLSTGFKFKRALMQEHFNENYMESTKFPKASFRGTIADPSKVNFNKEGTYVVAINGSLSIHGVTNKLSIPATIRVANRKIIGETKFDISLADYNIKIPSLVSKQVSETVTISVNCLYEPYDR